MRVILRCCLLIGLPLSMAGMAAMAALLTASDLPPALYPLMAALPVLTGCLSAAAAAGRILRKGGIRCGAITAALLTGIWYTAVCIGTGELHSPLLLTAALPCGILGGVIGVNRTAPKIRRRQHTLIAARERAIFLPMLLHRPPRRGDVLGAPPETPPKG